MRASILSVTGRTVLGAAVFVLAVLPAGAQVIDPTSCDLELPPGVFEQVGLQVCVPGIDVTKADIFLLADNTASMGAVIASIQSGAAGLTSQLLNLQGFDIQIGAGNYTDIPPFVPNPFELQQPITNVEADIITAINNWTFAAGGDVAESQFYAMHRICNDPAIGFRPDAKRIIVWFGDSPAHDPICAPILQLYGEAPIDVTEASLTAELVGAGPFGGTSVIAISTPFSSLVPDALNNDPLGPGGIFAEDYTMLGCAQNGTAGQANRIAAATQGLTTEVTEPNAIVAAILDAINSVLNEVTITLVPTGDIAPFVSLVEPVEFVVQLPNDSQLEECVEFTITFEGQNCVENTSVFEGGIDVLINGNPVATKTVTITQPGCIEAVCLLFLGFEDVSLPIPGGSGNDAFHVLPLQSWAVLLDSVPKFHIPRDPVLDGVSVFFQVGMSNWIDFPNDPIKTSNGLEVVLGHDSYPYGNSSGMQMFLKQPPLLGGTLEPGFSIDGL